jgi:hypothetical protein
MAFACLEGFLLRTNVYIDGFNLYFAIKRTPYKWLDISSLCNRLLPGHNINRIYYFTAKVQPLPHDLTAPQRQEVYLRALKTLSNVEIKEGHFVQWERFYPRSPLAYVHPELLAGSPLSARVLKAEEKGSDVNLASFLLRDCFNGQFEKAAVISNDSDLTTPIKIVVRDCNKPVVIINPNQKIYSSRELVKAASSFMRTINESAYRSCQFAPVLSDSVGTFTKPPTW